MRNITASPTNSLHHFLVAFSIPTNEALMTESQRYNSSGIGEMPLLNMPIKSLKVAILPLDLHYSRLTHSGEFLTTDKLHKKKQGGLFCHYVKHIRVLKLIKIRIFFSFLTNYLRNTICKCSSIDDFILLR